MNNHHTTQIEKHLHIMLSGPGLIGVQHARLVRDHPRCDLVAIVAPATDENLEFARSVNTPLFSDIETALESTRIDGAIISSPNKFHEEQATACIQRGIPVLVEKPITDSLESARRLVALSQATGVPVLVGHHRTYSTLLDVAERFLRSDEFGRPVALQGSALFYKPTYYFDEGPWRTQPGGGPILINLIHEIGLMRFFFGEISSVFAEASSAIRGFKVEDSVALTLRFANDALGTFLLSDVAASNKSWEMTSGENPRYAFYKDVNCYHFTGTNGSLDFPSMNTCYYRRDELPSWWVPFEHDQFSVERADPLYRQLDHFVSVIQGEVRPRVSAKDGYCNMLVVQAIKDSVAERRPVHIPATSAKK